MAKIMNFFFCILCVAISNAIFAIDIKILPNVPELTLTSGANYVIRCQGSSPVKWNITNTTTNENSSIQIIPTFTETNQIFVSLLILTGTIPEYVGYYSCIPSSVGLQVDTIHSEKIYLFVRSSTHLLLNVSSYVTQDEFGDITIPCRPTSPDISITIKKNNLTIVSEYKYSTKEGYTFITPSRNFSGTYRCDANMNNINQSQIFLVVIQREPKFKNINIIKNEFHKVGEVCSVECKVKSYPLSDVSWAFKECSNYEHCETKFNNISKNMHREYILNETTLKSILNITANKTGILLCRASNDFESYSIESKFWLTDIDNNINGMAVNGPPIILIGDNLTFKCGVNKFNYNGHIIWTHQPINRTDTFIIDPHVKDQSFILSNSSTNYSHYSCITIFNINQLFNGEYICKVTEKSQLKTVKLSYPLMVRKPYKPRIYEYSNSTYVNLTDSVTLKCRFHGLPQPTISWNYNNQNLEINNNDTRISVEDRNQQLQIRNISKEHLGFYKCIALNRMGNSSIIIELMQSTAIDANLDFSNKENTNIVNWTFVFVLLNAFCILVSLIYNFLTKRKLDKFRQEALHSFNPDLGIYEPTNVLPYDESFEFSRDKINLGIKIGSGAFGVVFKAEAIDIIEKNVTSTIAVKMVKPGSHSSHVNALISELKIMIHLGQHVNIVNLLGAYTENNIFDKWMILIEYCRFGNLREYMLKQGSRFVNHVTDDGRLSYNYKMKSLAHNPCYEYDPNKKNPNYENDADENYTEKKIDETGGDTGDDGYLLSVAVDDPESRYYYLGDYEEDKTKKLCTHDLFYWSFQVARGMQYLATKKILHGDLAARNILLADNNIVKISDFGFAKTMCTNENYIKKSDGPLPIKWMAIESLQQQMFSIQSDVWAFGIVLWEIFSLGFQPYPGIHARDLLLLLKEGYRMEKPQYANPDIYNIMLRCWKEEPKTRPSFTDLVEDIDNLFESDRRALNS